MAVETLRAFLSERVQLPAASQHQKQKRQKLIGRRGVWEVESLTFGLESLQDRMKAHAVSLGSTLLQRSRNHSIKGQVYYSLRTLLLYIRAIPKTYEPPSQNTNKPTTNLFTYPRETYPKLPYSRAFLTMHLRNILFLLPILAAAAPAPAALSKNDGQSKPEKTLHH